MKLLNKQIARNFSRTVLPAGEVVHGFVLKTDPTYRLFFSEQEKYVSPWHDIPLFPNASDHSIVNFVNEIPKGSVEKMEIATEESNNPIKQDTKKGKLRNYPFASLVNYGALPQTWENPFHVDAETNFKGDNDPLDVCEVGSEVKPSGEVYAVKVLGILAMIDEGELDWKVLAINVDDPIAKTVSTVADLEKAQPGKIAELINWFKFYKVPDGKPVNEFAFNEQALDAPKAVDVIEQTNKFWEDKAALKKAGLWVD